MARQFHNNWACTRIRDLIYQDGANVDEVADALSTHPRFRAIIQKAIDRKDDLDFEPGMPGGDLAERVVSELSDALVAVDSDD